MNKIKLILIYKDNKYFVKDLESDFHTEFGFIKKDVLQSTKGGDLLTTNTGKEFSVFEPFFIDQYQKIKRGAQIISLKDIGVIIAECGINRDSVILDSGAGSGASVCFFASVCKKVISYELREDFYKIVQKNIDFLDLKNITLKNQDIYLGIDEKNLDVIILDLPEPWNVIPHAIKALKPGGFLVSYSPCIPQVADFVNALGSEFVHLKSVEVTEREWEISQRKVRPKTRQLGHTGFLTFTRKIV
ncbi:MAG: tRNA (adenine-N1)-methyltransferase [archaeon]